MTFSDRLRGEEEMSGVFFWNGTNSSANHCNVTGDIFENKNKFIVNKSAMLRNINTRKQALNESSTK